MAYGWTRRLLRVDLTEKTIVKENLPKEWMRKYIGCRGINDIILYSEAGPDVHAFDPENRLIFGTGPLDGTPVGMGRVSIQTKHPEGYICEGGFGGDWGPELKFAGYDHIVIQGKSVKPVYLYINDDEIELRDATHLWGKDVLETTKAIKEEVGIPDIKVACIGQAGENLVARAKVFNKHHSGGRGCGTVMGDKKLKAIAVMGSGSVKISDPHEYLKAFRAIKGVLDLKDASDYFVPGWSFMSANLMLEGFNELGWLHAHNAQKGSLENALKGEEYIEKYVVKPKGGFCCPFPACGRRFEVKEGKYAGTSGDEREGGFAYAASVVGLRSWDVLLKIRDLCDRHGLDEFMIFYTIGWAMECYERGILTWTDTEGLDLVFGNEDVLVPLVEKIIKREGFGDLLAKGAFEAAKTVGKGSERYVLAIKGQELEVMPQRGVYQFALSLAVSENGPDHTRWYPPYPPNPNTIPSNIELPFDPFMAFQTRNVENKGSLVKWLYDSRAVLESLPTCVFVVRGILGIDMDPWLRIFNATTGINFTSEEFIKVGERIVNIERAYNVREGFRRKDDVCPRRMMEEPIADRHIPPLGENLDLMLDDYYTLRDWDLETAIPTEAKLKELDLDFVNNDLAALRE
ncbi:MAG: aldehyde ferredoxin oxidoreductase family protein [Methanosarcinaceae archaeon]|nr:aldehyde ferredoxin oxidoreductase family protein [Methanosarcinaceae archaeon]